MNAFRASVVAARYPAAIVALLLALPVSAQDFAAQRADLVEEVRRFASFAGDDAFRDDVLESLNTVERHRFVPRGEVPFAYENRPLSIGWGQTISQPYIVALMTQLAKPEPAARALDVGTGSGYQAAVLAELGVEVLSMEIVEPLAISAKALLADLGYDRVTVRHGDGYHGWPDRAPFDAIIVTAAASHVPPPLVDQLRPGGRMVIPVGSRFFTQHLMLVEKRDDGTPTVRQLLPVRFVPLTGGH